MGVTPASTRAAAVEPATEFTGKRVSARARFGGLGAVARRAVAPAGQLRETERGSASRALGWAALLCLFVGATSLPGCHTYGMRPAVTMTMKRDATTPKSALVYIDEQYIGTLSYVGARGIRLPEGEHRITVEKVGYFPYDTIVVSDREPIHLDVKLVKIPD